MDLTTGYPRSVSDKLAGIVMLARTIDKGRAKLAGTLGEYNYDCPMDKRLFDFLGTTGDEFLAVVKAHDDAAIAQYVQDTYLSKKTPEQIETFNAKVLSHSPQDDESRAYFQGLLDKVAPGRSDITTWAQLLDADEGRSVAVAAGA